MEFYIKDWKRSASVFKKNLIIVSNNENEKAHKIIEKNIQKYEKI